MQYKNSFRPCDGHVSCCFTKQMACAGMICHPCPVALWKGKRRVIPLIRSACLAYVDGAAGAVPVMPRQEFDLVTIHQGNDSILGAPDGASL